MGGESSASSLAPGFRFHPTDEELVSYYLKRKLTGKPFRFDAISEIDIYKFEPWDLPGQSRLKSRDREWYFFSALDKKYGNGWRTNRATEQGYWKTTGKDRPVHRATRSVGMKKTLVYHIGRAPKGERTNWVMHEYRLEDETLGKAKDAFVLCRIFQKSGTGPKNGEQYGAPFIEEEWDEDVTAPEQEVVMANGGSSNGSDEETSLAHNSAEEIMENQPFVVTVSFKSLLSEILQKFKLSPPLYGVSESREEQFQAWVKIQIDDIEIEGIKFWGALSHKKVESEMDAARTAIRYLKTIFEFEVDDVNLEDIQTYNQHYESVERENEELLVKNVTLAIPPLNVALPGNNWNVLEAPSSFLGEDQKLPIASAENAENGPASELPVEKEFFDIPKEFKMEQTPVKNEFLELSDLSNSADVKSIYDDQATQELSYFAGPSNPPDVNGGSYIEMNDLANCMEGVDPLEFGLYDLDPSFFDATDNDFFNDVNDGLDFSNMFCDDPVMGDPLFSGEVNTETGQAYLTIPEPSKPASEIASSSMPKPEKVSRELNYDEGWEGSIAKQVSRMLGSIPAPPAFAAEFPTKESAILGQTSTSLSSSSIHVTAGMIHITSSMTVSGNGKDDWLWRKNGGVDVLLPYGLTSNEAMTVEHLMSSKAVSVVARSSFYLIFLWVLILSVSCKIGSYIYTR
ncbi:hypothetical protein MKW94_025777 [Papaver nudicaule]|uniref:NAC domain-containing protein n=1 Tax=Papaver nudicaule TaxID=74823 RepID=A0AA41RXN5_PAPNU|nr:hypothetical protein [Papaver nudicaule]